MPQRAKERFNRINVAFPILEHYAKHYTAGGLAAEQAIGVLALFLNHEALVGLLLSTYESGQVFGGTKLLEDLLVPRRLGRYEKREVLEEGRAALAPVEIDPRIPGLSYEDEGRIRVQIYPTRIEEPCNCAWRLECQERNENHLALKQVGECLRRVLEGELLTIGTTRLQFT